MDQQDNLHIDWKTASDDEILDADLIIACGFETASDEDKAALIGRMTRVVQQAVANRVLDQIGDTEKAEIDRLMNANDTDGLNQFLEAHVPNFPDLVTEETVKFKRAMLTGDVPA